MAAETNSTNLRMTAPAAIRSTAWLCRLRYLGEMTVCVCIIGTLAVVTLTACILLRPVGMLIERSAAKERKRHNGEVSRE